MKFRLHRLLYVKNTVMIEKVACMVYIEIHPYIFTIERFFILRETYIVGSNTKTSYIISEVH